MAQRWLVSIKGCEQMGVLPSESLEIGRKPIRPLADSGVRRLDVPDETRSMSKRHVLFAVSESGSATVRDLGSTNGTYVVREDGRLIRLPEGADFPLPSTAIRMQLGDVPVDFVRVDEPVAQPRPLPSVGDLFSYAMSDAKPEPDAMEMSVDDILDLRAGEPTSMFDAGRVTRRAGELRAAQARTFPPLRQNPLTGEPIVVDDEPVADSMPIAIVDPKPQQPRDLFADAMAGRQAAADAPQEPAGVGGPGTAGPVGGMVPPTVAMGVPAAMAAGPIIDTVGETVVESAVEPAAEPDSAPADGPADETVQAYAGEPAAAAMTVESGAGESAAVAPAPADDTPDDDATEALRQNGTAAVAAAEAGPDAASGSAPGDQPVMQSGPQSDAQSDDQSAQPAAQSEQSDQNGQPAESSVQSAQSAQSAQSNQPAQSGQSADADPDRTEPAGDVETASGGYVPVFEPGSVFERVSRGDFAAPQPLVEAGGFTSDEARRTTDFDAQFEIARHPQLLPFLALNPALYDDLYGWLAARGDKDIDAALQDNPGYQEYREAVGK